MPKRSAATPRGYSFKRFKKAYRGNLPKTISKWRRAPLRSGGWGRRTQELKVVDVFKNDSMLPDAGSVFLLNGMAQGVDYYQRVGRKVILKSIMLKGSVTVEPTGNGNVIPLASMSCRVSVVYDAQSNGTLPSYADIYQSVDSVGTTTNTTFSGVNLNNRDRFKILKDWTMELRPKALQSLVAGVPTTGNFVTDPGFHSTKNLKWYKKLNQEMIFGDVADTIGSIQTGSLLLVIQSDGGGTVANSADPYLDMQCRIRFADP
jgi:hypothetical protein